MATVKEKSILRRAAEEAMIKQKEEQLLDDDEMEIAEEEKEEVEQASRQLLIGIDLGTSKTSLMADNGLKLLVRSVVGYPKDIISKKMVGEGPVFGREALKKKNFLDLCFPLADGVIQEASKRDYQAALEMVRFLVHEAKKEAGGSEVCGVIGIPARASIANKELLLDIAKEVMNTALVVSEPFMVAYEMNNLDNCIVIDIGAGTVDICGMKGTIPNADDQVTFLKGGDYIDERLEAAIARRYPGVQITKSLACRIKEEHAFVGEPEEPVVVTLRADGKPAQFDVTREIRSICESIVPDIIEQLEAMITKFDPEEQEATLQNIILAGGGSKIKGLDTLIAKHLKDYGEVKVTRVEDPDYAGCSGALSLARDVPISEWHQIGLIYEG